MQKCKSWLEKFRMVSTLVKQLLDIFKIIFHCVNRLLGKKTIYEKGCVILARLIDIYLLVLVDENEG